MIGGVNGQEVERRKGSRSTCLRVEEVAGHVGSDFFGASASFLPHSLDFAAWSRARCGLCAFDVIYILCRRRRQQQNHTCYTEHWSSAWSMQ